MTVEQFRAIFKKPMHRQYAMIRLMRMVLKRHRGWADENIQPMEE